MKNPFLTYHAPQNVHGLKTKEVLDFINTSFEKNQKVRDSTLLSDEMKVKLADNLKDVALTTGASNAHNAKNRELIQALSDINGEDPYASHGKGYQDIMKAYIQNNNKSELNTAIEHKKRLDDIRTYTTDEDIGDNVYLDLKGRGYYKDKSGRVQSGKLEDIPIEALLSRNNLIDYYDITGTLHSKATPSFEGNVSGKKAWGEFTKLFDNLGSQDQLGYVQNVITGGKNLGEFRRYLGKISSNSPAIQAIVNRLVLTDPKTGEKRSEHNGLFTADQFNGLVEDKIKHLYANGMTRTSLDFAKKEVIDDMLAYASSKIKTTQAVTKKPSDLGDGNGNGNGNNLVEVGAFTYEYNHSDNREKYKLQQPFNDYVTTIKSSVIGEAESHYNKRDSSTGNLIPVNYNEFKESFPIVKGATFFSNGKYIPSHYLKTSIPVKSSRISMPVDDRGNIISDIPKYIISLAKSSKIEEYIKSADKLTSNMKAITLAKKTTKINNPEELAKLEDLKENGNLLYNELMSGLTEDGMITTVPFLATEVVLGEDQDWYQMFDTPMEKEAYLHVLEDRMVGDKSIQDINKKLEQVGKQHDKDYDLNKKYTTVVFTKLKQDQIINSIYKNKFNIKIYDNKYLNSAIPNLNATKAETNKGAFGSSNRTIGSFNN